MGSWSGHTLPGSLFIFLGITWTITTSYRYFFPRFGATSPRRICRIKWGIVEGGFIAFGAGFGLLIEQLLPWEPRFHLTEAGSGEFTRANNWSHSTMYAFFIVFGMTKILVIKFPKEMPHCLHHITLALALGVEGYLFYFHTHGREELDTRVHVLLLLAIWPTSLVFLILAFVDNNDNLASGYAIFPQSRTDPRKNDQREAGFASLLQNDEDIKSGDSAALCAMDDVENVPLHDRHANAWGQRDNGDQNNYGVRNWKTKLQKRKKILTLQLCASVLIILQGTWFWQAAYVLYPPSQKPWKQEDRKNVAFLTMFFAWHCLLAMTTVGVIFLVFGIIRRRK